MNQQEDQQKETEKNISLNSNLTDMNQELDMNDFDMDELPPVPTLRRHCTGAYRETSISERLTSESIVANLSEPARLLMEKEGISLNEAMRRLDDKWDEHQWTTKPIKEGDLKPGVVVYSTKVPVVACNSVLLEGLYNDTVILTGESGVTYRNKYNGKATHSGDIMTPYGLRHTIVFETECNEAVVLSTPWDGWKEPGMILSERR